MELVTSVLTPEPQNHTRQERDSEGFLSDNRNIVTCPQIMTFVLSIVGPNK